MTDVIQRKKFGIYFVKGLRNAPTAKIIPQGFIELASHESADRLEKKVQLEQYINIEIFQCAIVDSFLVTTKKLPMMYAAIIYEKGTFRSILFSIFVYFTILDNITSEAQLINSDINGKFTIELYMDGKHHVLDDQFSNEGYIGFDQTSEYLVTLASDENFKPVIKKMITEKDIERKELYKKIAGECSFVKPSDVSKAYSDLLNKMKNDKSKK